MAGFFSKASSFLSSQADQDAPTHGGKGGKGDTEEETRKPPSSGGYGDLLASAQSFMATSKPSDKEGESDKPPSSGGYGDLLASAQTMMGSAKLSSGEDKKDAAAKTTSSGDSGYGDMYASAQVLMGAAKASREGAAADMGEVAGATANLIGGATQYGNLEKTALGEYAHKAETYLQDYQTSHGKASHKPAAAEEESNPPAAAVSEPQKSPVRSNEKIDEEEDQEEGSSKIPPIIKNPVARSSEEEYN